MLDKQTWSRQISGTSKSTASSPKLEHTHNVSYSGLILGVRPINERRRYFVTTFLIGWAHAWNQPCYCRAVWFQRFNKTASFQKEAMRTQVAL